VLIRNALSLSSARLAAKGMAFFAAVLVARRLGAGDYGQYSLILAFSLLFSYLADFGLVSLLVREVACEPFQASDLLSRALTAQVTVSLAGISALLCAGFLLEPSGLIRIGILLAAAGLFLESLGRPFSGVLLGQQRVLASAVATATGSIVNTTLLIGVILVRPGVLNLVLVTIPVGVLSALLPAALVWRTGVRPSMSLRLDAIRLLQQSLPFAILAGSLVLYDRIDIVLLAHLKSSVDVGIYAAADRVIEGLLVIPAGIGAALYPTLASNPVQARRRLRFALSWTLPLGLLLTVLAVLPGSQLVELLFGARYSGVGAAFAILAPTLLLQMLNIPLAYLLQAERRTWSAIAAVLGGLLTNVALNFVLIPAMGFRGAALSATIAELTVAGVLAASLRLGSRRAHHRIQIAPAALSEPAPNITP